MIVDSGLYRHGVRAPAPLATSDLARVRAERAPGDFIWVGLHEPTPEELQQIADQLGFHPLATEDALKAHQRPKLERYDQSLFLVLKTLTYIDADDAVETGEISLFVGEGYVVTVRHGAGGDLSSTRAHLEEVSDVLGRGPAAVVYAVCDKVVDDYTLVGRSLEEDVDEVEQSVFSGERTRDSERIYTLKREIAEVRRAVLPLRQPMMDCAEGRVPGINGDVAPYFRDVADHLSRVAEVVDNLDQLLSSAFDAHVAQISVQQNDDMRTISAGAALVVVPTLIAGIYGMNFKHMPELDWRYGYPFALVMMVGVAAGLWVWFKRSGWL
ncbi:magnesium/cobalt transporter CorA [Nocardioides sp. zg-DK7169]|uniref:magnesium/cobalt transporter CorA n=1 Tax=Nocardioides sp. zg-DK7169 TaxID=2736600 RepID=UPI0015539D4D|nr:magnesium/cobalt transporter CorA [Nocardioides sp. zg-DK7169]NPC96376.1 magnesium/cobalt transporter CorA [Nocardioides sp. zg-DK7169]